VNVANIRVVCSVFRLAGAAVALGRCARLWMQDATVTPEGYAAEANVWVDIWGHYRCGLPQF
jgi:hypothetical protein